MYVVYDTYNKKTVMSLFQGGGDIYVGKRIYCDSNPNQYVRDAYLKLLSLDDSKRNHIIALIKDL